MQAAAARGRLADQVYTPWWYHPILGALLALLVVQVGGVFAHTGVLAMSVPIVGIIVLGGLYRRLTGVDLTGPHTPDGGRRGRLLLSTYLVALLPCLVSSFFLGEQMGRVWVAWLLAAIVFAATVVVGRVYDGLLRAQLRDSLL